MCGVRTMGLPVTQFAEALIVREDDDDIGFRRFRRGAGDQDAAEEQNGDECFHGDVRWGEKRRHYSK